MKGGPMRKKRKFRIRRTIVRLLGIIAICYAVSCIPPKSFRETKNPRGGSALENKVAIVYSQKYHVDFWGFEKLHPHPQKYGNLYLALLKDGFDRSEDVFVPDEVTDDQILLAHSELLLENLQHSKNIAHYMEVPLMKAVPIGLLDSGLLKSFRRQTGGTITAARLAMDHGIGVNLGGGWHHAKRDAGEGFCIYNDLAIAIRVLQAEGIIRRALVIDLDVHQGNGTAEIFEDDDSVYTFSMHQGNIYPVPKATSDWDIELKSGVDDGTYLTVLAGALDKMFDEVEFDIVFLQGGADVLRGDQLASLNVSPLGLVLRDAMVIDKCVKHKVPVVTTLGGGYQNDSWKAQYASIKRTLEKYGTVNAKPQYSPRKASVKEKLYTK